MSCRRDIGLHHPCLDCPVSVEAVCNVLDAPTLADFRNIGCNVRLAGGQSLFHQGDDANAIFSLTRGVVKLYCDLPDGRRQIVAFHFPGEFIDLCDGAALRCTARAVSPASLCRFDVERFNRFAQTMPTLARSRHGRVISTLVAIQERVALLGRATARERLAAFLNDVLRRFRHSLPGRQHLVHLPMSRVDIADYLGLTKETVCREFTSLRQAGLIRPHARGLLEILDLQRLSALAQIV